jgi:nucleotide-binding universal stress UspA family protein
LLAYDDSPKAQEALFVATYLACCWDVTLVVLTIPEGEQVADDALARARGYLQDRGVQADFVQERGPTATEILVTAEQKAVDLIVMGGYGFSPIVESAFGSTVGDVLRSSVCPVLICQ